MNLTTVLVTLAIAGSATPGITKLALQPVIAQKRATNFGVAEMQALEDKMTTEYELPPLDFIG